MRWRERQGWADTDLMESVTALGDDVGLLAGEPEAETQRLDADRTLLVLVERIATRNHRKGRRAHVGVRMDAGVVGRL